MDKINVYVCTWVIIVYKQEIVQKMKAIYLYLEPLIGLKSTVVHKN